MTLFRDREPYKEPENPKMTTWKEDLDRRLLELEEAAAVRSLVHGNVLCYESWKYHRTLRPSCWMSGLLQYADAASKPSQMCIPREEHVLGWGCSNSTCKLG